MTTLATATDFEGIQRLNADLLQASRDLGSRQVRYLTDLYYQIQEFRKAAGNQDNATVEEDEPNELISSVYSWFKKVEANVKRSLDEFTGVYTVGQWMKSVCGVGPVIAAGLLTHFDIREAETFGKFWRFAGYDPTVRWESAAICRAWLKENGWSEAGLPAIAAAWGRDVKTLRKFAMTTPKGEPKELTLDGLSKALARKPWNGDLKRLLYLAGDCFVKFQSNPKDVYGKIYLERKEYEARKNAHGEYRNQAEHSLATKNFGRDTEARKHYEAGKLPPARLHLRALRYAHKLFVAHVHHVMYVDYYGKEPPVPYALDKLVGEGHRHYLPPPNWPFEGHGLPLRALFEKG